MLPSTCVIIHYGLVTSYGAWIRININTCDDFLLGGTKAFTNSMLTYHQWYFVAFTCDHLHKKWLRNYAVTRLQFWGYSHISTWVNQAVSKSVYSRISIIMSNVLAQNFRHPHCANDLDWVMGWHKCFLIALRNVIHITNRWLGIKPQYLYC